MVQILFNLLIELLRLYSWVLIIACVFSVLTAMGVLDTRNRLVWTVGDFLYRVTEPVLAPVRRILPSFGAVDLSPFVVLLLIDLLLIPLIARIEEAILLGSVQPVLLGL